MDLLSEAKYASERKVEALREIRQEINSKSCILNEFAKQSSRPDVVLFNNSLEDVHNRNFLFSEQAQNDVQLIRNSIDDARNALAESREALIRDWEKETDSREKELIRKISSQQPEKTENNFSKHDEAEKIPETLTIREEPKFLPISSPEMKLSSQQKVDLYTISASDEFNEVLEQRRQVLDLSETKEQFSRDSKYKRDLNSALSQIAVASETITSVLKCFKGTPRRNGPYTFLSRLGEENNGVIPKEAMILLCEQIVMVASSNVSSTDVLQGNLKFSLVYIALALAHHFPGFFDTLLGVLYVKSPFTYPGLFKYVLEKEMGGTGDLNLKSLGRQKGEQDSDYILRMQAISGFQSALYQTDLSLFSKQEWQSGDFIPLEKCSFEFHPYSQKLSHKTEGRKPIHPSLFNWRFMAKTLNCTLSRFTPYILVSFLSVCGFEIAKVFPLTTFAKLLKLLSSEEFKTKCQKLGNFDSKHDHNDHDRFKSTFEAFQNFYAGGSLKIQPPGRKKDARNLVFDTSSQ